MATPIPTPAMREADYEKSQYYGPAMAELRILKQQMQLGKLTIGTRTVDFGNVTCFCRICFNLEEVYIHIASKEIEQEFTSGVIIHPRSGVIIPISITTQVSDEFGYHSETQNIKGVAGGWTNGVTTLTTQYIFPLVDADNASFGIKREGLINVGAFLGANGNYGNLYWTDGVSVLSWHGTPTRHFRLSSDTEITGFSLYETAIAGTYDDKPQYTTFSTKLYQNGAVLATAPMYSWPYSNSGVGGRCLILGAMKHKSGAVYIVAQSDHYNAPDPKPKPGYYLTLWELGGITDGWTLISEVNYGRNGLPWFGDKDATIFICSNGDTLTTTGVLTIKQPTYGSYMEEYVGPDGDAHWRFELGYTGTNFFEYTDNKKISSVVTITASSEETASGGDKGQATYTSNMAVLYTLSDAAIRSRAQLSPDNETIIGSIICYNGRERILQQVTWNPQWFSNPIVHVDGETGTVTNTPDNGTVVYWVWHAYSTDIGGGLFYGNVAQVWVYGYAPPFEAC